MGDGGYPALVLLDQSDDHNGVGAITLFQDAAVGLNRAGLASDLGLILARTAPMILGRIHSDGVLYFSDSSKSYDSRDVVVDVDVLPGDYLVVVWVTTPLSMDDTMRPLALGAFSGPIAASIEASVGTVDTEALIAGMWGRNDLMVHSNVWPLAEAVGVDNWESDREHDVERALSWVIQAAENGVDSAQDFLHGEAIDFDEALLEAIERRGLRILTANWWTPTGDQRTDDFCTPIARAADDSTMPPEIARLAEHQSAFVRRAAAARDGLPHPTLKHLAFDSDDAVRSIIAQRDDAPAEILVALANDRSVEVQAAVAANPLSPADVLSELARRGRWTVSLASNESTPVEAILLLSQDANEATRVALAGRADLPNDLLWTYALDSSSDVRKAVAGNAAVPVDVQGELSRDPDMWVRFFLACNASLDDHVVSLLAMDSESMVRGAVADRADCPLSVLAALATDAEQDVRDAVYRNPSATDEIRASAAILGITTESDTGEEESMHSPWDDDDDLYAAHIEANNLLQDGKYEDAMDVLAEDAKRGGPWSLASYTWKALERGEHARACQLYDETFEACRDFTEECIEEDDESELASVAFTNIVNARSNDALNRLALGGPATDAGEVWQEMAPSGHAESVFYPAVLALRAGQVDQARAMVRGFPSEVLVEMRDTINEGLNTTGWFVDWSRDAQRVLSLLEDDRPSSSPSTAGATAPSTPGGTSRFCTQCGAPRTSPADRFCGSCGTAL